MNPERVLKSAFCRDLIVSLAVANLCYLWTWQHLVFASAEERFLDPQYGWRDLAGTLLNVLLLAAVFLLVFAASRRASRRWLRWSLRMGPLLFLMVQFRVSLGTLLNSYIERVGRPPVLAVLAVAALGTVALLWMLRRRTVAVRDFVLIMVALFTALTFLRAGWGIGRDLTRREAHPQAPSGASQAQPAGTRVVWFVFDELDYRLAFEQRPPNVLLPEFDRLKAQSVFLVKAHPAAQKTLVAIPAMLTGLRINTSRPAGKRVMELALASGQTVELTQQPSIFSRLAAQGRTSAVVGWYFPYCSVYGPHLLNCHWEPMQTPRPQPTVAKAMVRQSAQLLPWFRRISARREYDGLVEAASRAVTNLRADFTLIHLNVPHVPPLYDARTGGRNLFILRRDWYEDNLRLADMTLGLLRRKMEEAGHWDESTVIVTSDHQYRQSTKYDGKSDPRMPVLVKLPRQQTAATHAQEFHGEKMFGLVSALFEDDIETPEQLAEWLAREQTAAEAK